MAFNNTLSENSEATKQLEIDISQLRNETNELEKRARLLQSQLSLTEKQRDSSNNLLSSFSAEAEMGSDEKSVKIIESMKMENENYKEMIEEYDRTVKELRSQIEQLQ